MKRWKGTCIVLMLFFTGFAVSLPVSALDASDFNLGGYAQTRAAGFLSIQEPETLDAASLSSVRLNASLNICPDIYLDAAYTVSPKLFPADSALAAFGLTGDSGGTDDAGPYRAADLPARMIEFSGLNGESENENEDDLQVAVDQNLDRLFATVYLPFGDLYFGRQAISWGSARVINPTSVFSSFSPAGLEAEEQRGVDALRLRIPFGMMGEFDFGYVFGENFRYADSAAFARLRSYVLQTDLSFLVMDVQEHLLAGVDAARSIGGAGAWMEAAYVLPDAFSSEMFDGAIDFSSQHAALTFGLDYNFNSKLYGFAEYHFNSAGKSAPEEYLEFSLESDGLFQLFGQQYGILGGTYQLHPLLPVNFLALVNAGDPSAAISLEMEYSFTQDLTFTLGGLISIGDAPDRDADGSPTVLNSEFGMNPQLVYLSGQIYF